MHRTQIAQINMTFITTTKILYSEILEVRRRVHLDLDVLKTGRIPGFENNNFN